LCLLDMGISHVIAPALRLWFAYTYLPVGLIMGPVAVGATCQGKSSWLRLRSEVLLLNLLAAVAAAWGLPE
jgi:hypothetical protein